MKIVFKFWPLLSMDEAPIVPPVLAIEGEKVTLNGVETDFSVLPDGYEIWCTDIDAPGYRDYSRRIGGALTIGIELLFKHGASEAVRFPVDVVVTKDGSVKVPVDVHSPDKAEIIKP